MIEQVRDILSNFTDVEVTNVTGEDDLLLVFHTTESVSQSMDIAVEINNNLNGELLYSGEVIRLENSHEDIWYGFLDREPNTDLLYPEISFSFEEI